jgi:inner membrane protein
MTRSTHQVAAFALAVEAIVLVQPLLGTSPIAPETSSLAILVANLLGLRSGSIILPLPLQAGFLYVFFALIGGVFPDIDRPSRLWSRILTSTLLGGHRHLSHSLLGLALAAILALLVLAPVGSLFAVPVGILWLGFVAGYTSHLILDGLTRDGVPLLFPWPMYFGLPPVGRLRIRTGGWAEQFVMMPALLAMIAWMGFSHGDVLTSIWR